MLVTINTDASYSLRHKLGAFAFWIACNEGRAKRSGLLRGEVSHSEEAELRCMANALAYISDCTFRTPVSRIVINTDCKFAINKITGGGQPKEPNDIWKVALWIRDKITQMGITVQFRYVEAHRFERGGKYDTARHAVNNWCDLEAKRHLGIALDKLPGVRRDNNSMQKYISK